MNPIKRRKILVYGILIAIAIAVISGASIIFKKVILDVEMEKLIAQADVEVSEDNYIEAIKIYTEISDQSRYYVDAVNKAEAARGDIYST